MPVTESEFNLNQLWPPSNFHWMAPGAVSSTAATFGPGLDAGALRVNNGIWEILLPKSPTQEDQTDSAWVLLEPSNAGHLAAANGFRRYGPGHSYGPGHNMHDEAIGYFQIVHNRMPTKMEQLDIEHDRNLWNALVAEKNRIIGFSPDEPTPEPKPEPEQPKPNPKPEPQPGPPPTLPPLPPLSSPDLRAAEIMTMLPEFLRRPWLVPLVQEAVVIERRLIERVARRVAELLASGGAK